MRSESPARTKTSSLAHGSDRFTPTSHDDGGNGGSSDGHSDPRPVKPENATNEPPEDPGSGQPLAPTTIDGIDMALQSEVINSVDTSDPVVGRWQWTVKKQKRARTSFFLTGKYLIGRIVLGGSWIRCKGRTSSGGAERPVVTLLPCPPTASALKAKTIKDSGLRRSESSDLERLGGLLV